MKSYELYKKYAIFYKLDKDEVKELWDIIEPIASSKEFTTRCSDPFFHHDKVTLGEHLLCGTIVTYKLAKRKKKNIKLACLIAIFHDMYEIPWQNQHDHKRLMNKHGFVHSLEGAINAITWYPEYFTHMKEAEIIVDGIIHHMFPLPVRAINGSEMNLNNDSTYKKLPDKYRDMIIKSSKRWSIGKVSICRSKYKEGRIMSKADKKVALGLEIKKPSSFLRLIHGNNKEIAKK